MRSCIFCGLPANSKEDAWPLWLSRRLGTTEVGTFEAQRGRHTPKTWRGAKLRVGYVCKSCNNGWMSQLETGIQPIIEDLLGDEPVTLDSASQMKLAVWSVKNAMVFEPLREGRLWYFTSPERRTLSEGRLPPHTSVWIAKCVSHRGLYCSASDLTGIGEMSNDHVKACAITMGFGPLAIQILSGKLSRPAHENVTIIGDLRPGPWDQVAIQIWPIQSERIAWPAAMGLSGDSGLDKISQRWSPVKS